MDLITPVVAGAAGAFVKELANKGVDWFIQLVSSHSPEVQAQAKKNLENFLVRLASRVEALEAEIPVTQRGIFEAALSHPSSSLLMQKAMVSAAITDNDDRHEILSELIAQRLTAGAEDMIALVGGASCDVVGALSSKHIRLLGLMTRLLFIRPTPPPEISDQSQYDKYVISWCESLGEFCRGLETIEGIDFQHLVGLSCISMSIGSKDLTKILALPATPGGMAPPMEQLGVFPWWANFQKLWHLGIKYATPTSIGSLIGTLYHDSHLKLRTQIDW